MTMSSKVKQTVCEDKKSNALTKLFQDRHAQKKAQKLSDKLSSSFCMKKNEAVKINQTNFTQILSKLAQATLPKNEFGTDLLTSVIRFLDRQDELMKNDNLKMLTKISYKKESFDIEPFRTIEKEITTQILKNKNVIHYLIFDIWYIYMRNKWQKITEKDEQVQLMFHKDVSVFGQFISNVIYHLFGQWFYFLEKKYDVYGKIIKEFVPNLITHNKQWNKIYNSVLMAFGQRQLKHLNTQFYHDIIPLRKEFSGQGMENAFVNCIDVLKQVRDEYIPKRKIAKIKEFLLTVKQDVRKYQEWRVEKGMQKEVEEMAVDDIVDFFAFCILKSCKPGIGQSLLYLQLFYDSGQNQAKYLSEAEILHSMVSIKSAADYLKEQDQKYQHAQRSAMILV